MRRASHVLRHGGGELAGDAPGDAADKLRDAVRQVAEEIASRSFVAVKMAREVLAHLSRPQIRSSMADEMIYQTFISRSDDMAELRAARAEERPPRFTGS